MIPKHSIISAPIFVSTPPIRPSNTAAAIAYLKTILDKEGIATETFESKPGMVTLVARIPGPAGVKPLMLMSHADVVPAVGANWTHPPFGADMSDGYVWARGAIDNKAHGIMALMTMLALKSNNVPLKRGVEMMVNPDEEAGGDNGANWMVEKHWDAIDPAFAFNEGGDGSPNWLGTKGTTFLVAVSEKRVDWLHIVVHGKGGHGSVPTARQSEPDAGQRASSSAGKSAADPNHADFCQRDAINRAVGADCRRRSN